MRILSSLRRQLVRLRDGLDGRLHASRHRRARRRLGEVRPASVLFICLGNICRSPYAEHVFRARGGAAVESASAGFILPGRQPPENAVEAAEVRGIDTTEHRSQVVSDDLLDDADAVFLFDRFNVRRLRGVSSYPADRVFWLGDFDPEWSGKRAVIDPWGKPPEEFQRTFARIDRCINEIIEVVGGGGSAPTTGESP